MKKVIFVLGLVFGLISGLVAQEITLECYILQNELGADMSIFSNQIGDFDGKILPIGRSHASPIDIGKGIELQSNNDKKSNRDYFAEIPLYTRTSIFDNDKDGIVDWVLVYTYPPKDYIGSIKYLIVNQPGTIS